MKKLLSIVLLALAFAWTAKASGDKPVSVEELPSQAQAFINSNFSNVKVSYAKEDNDWMDKSYEVVFVDGGKIEFDKNGQWKEINCKYSAVPTSALPSGIADFLNERHPGVSVSEIERTRNGYDLHLSNGLEMRFNNSMQFMGYDD